MSEVLSGDGDAIGMGALLQIAEMEVLTGRLVYEAGGEVGMHAGNVVRAAFAGQGGVSALLELFLHAAGRFVVEAAPEPKAPALGSCAGLVLEGCRLLDDWRRVEPLVLATVEPYGLLPAIARLRLDGRKPVWQAVQMAGVTRSSVVDPLLLAIEQGHLQEAAPPVPPRVLPQHLHADGSSAYDACIEVGRRLVREARYVEARQYFEMALSMRPDDRIATQNLRRVAKMEGR